MFAKADALIEIPKTSSFNIIGVSASGTKNGRFVQQANLVA
jgi:hypothetical protein